MTKDIKDGRIVYIGIGVFLWLTIGGISFIIEYLIKDILLNLNVQTTIIIWSKLIAQLITYSAGFILGINLIKSSKKSELTILRNIILLFISVQILQYFQPILTNLARTENYLKNSSDYYNFIETEPTQYLIITTFSFMTIIIAGVIIYVKR